MTDGLDWKNIATSYKTHNEQLIGKARQVDRLTRELENTKELMIAADAMADAICREFEIKGVSAIALNAAKEYNMLKGGPE